MKFGQGKLSRRRLLGGAAVASAAIPALHELVPHRGLHHALEASAAEPHMHGAAGAAAHAAHLGAVGRVDPRVNGFDPQEMLRDFDEGRMVGGVREWEFVAEEKEIEVAPGVRYAPAKASGCGSASRMARSIRTRSTSTGSTCPRRTAWRAWDPATSHRASRGRTRLRALPSGCSPN